jgi:energy-coupling factor transporter ATP-binding protein EcfA2
LNQAHQGLAVEALSFRYRDREELAIRDISLQVEPGELLLVAGASGCGKTTMIRCINGLIPRSYKGEVSGRIVVNGHLTGDMSLAEISQHVGTVLQDPERQILGTRVRHEVAFGLENLGLSRQEIRERIEEALARLNISHLRDRETFSLSGGEKQKVALSGVLAMRPNILLLDEPLASLDPASAQETLAIIRQLANEGMSILLVEHRVEDVIGIRPDRVMYMQVGEIQYLGPLQKLGEAVDYYEIKLPTPMIIENTPGEAPPEGLKTLAGAPREGDQEPLVRFEGVSFSYQEGVEVLHDVNLDIQAGDIIAILGPNGAGKTTLVKHAIGLLKPKAGRVLIDGQDTRDLSIAQIANTLGYVFQSPSHMLFAPTVYKELAFGPKNLRHSQEEIEKEVKEALEILNLTGMEEDPPLALSFGQQKRVSIGAILAMRSRILMMDEPTAGQDYKNYMDFMDSILKLPSFEAIVYITHDIDLAVIYANRVLLIDQGTIAADGPPEEVLCDFERIKASRLVPTSLLKANVEMYDQTQRFMRAESLAYISRHN